MSGGIRSTDPRFDDLHSRWMDAFHKQREAAKRSRHLDSPEYLWWKARAYRLGRMVAHLQKTAPLFLVSESDGGQS